MTDTKRQPGFTLIEMLVVISIIMLLLSIAAPSLSKAKRRARDVACLSNMHQSGIAIQAYLDDHVDTFAMAQSWADLVGVAGDPAYNPSNLYNANAIPESKRPLNHYSSDPRIAECPADLGDSYDSPAFDPVTNCFKAFGNSYQAPFSYDVLRTKYAFGTVTAAGVVAVRPRRHSEFKARFDNKVIQGDYVWWGNRRIEFAKSRWHTDDSQRKYNILFADWHAATTLFPPDQEAFWPGGDPPPDHRNVWW